MKTNQSIPTNISISISEEHKHLLPQIQNFFNNIKVEANYQRNSIEDLPLQVFIFLSGAITSGIAWDSIKFGITKLFNIDKKATITIRLPENNEMFIINEKDEVKALTAIPDTKHKDIKTLDDLFLYLNKRNTNWEETTLGEVIDFINEKINIKTISINNYISTENLLPDKLGIQKATNLPTIPNVSFFKKNDTLFSNIRTYFKKVWFANFDGGASNDVLIFRPKNENKLDKKFLFYFISSDHFINFTVISAKGTKMPRGDKEGMKNFQFLLPPLPEQKAIASVLSSFDDKIELLRQENKTLESLAQTIFHEQFGKYRPTDPLPEGWRVYSLSDLFSFIKGKKPTETSELKQNNFVPQILIDTFNGGKTIYANPKKTIRANSEDLLMVMDGASSGRIEFGYTGIIGSTLALLKIEKNIKSILYYFLKSKEKDIKEKTTGSAIPHTDKNKVYNYKIILPNNESELEKINTIFSYFREKSIINREQIHTLSRNRDELLPNLMNGSIKIKL